ncbi:zinc dependent phospholipase C family protein [Lacrimispora defluvii]|jgi:hypothetical protein|uniref:Zinc dependent phospholipase C family protein n=1 Tax=Lacrimispora defluvii TaxID=2719233 RepID=A0ABX1VXH5_9FIRM|nr:zinc dependent phospholipase C family protein [Lacrimispora defluvii]NNJ33041.1 zinc dependent phospholipase C family protein [Lacrimispora defluvii]
MKTIDHKNLADYLLESTFKSGITRYRKAFVIGCIVPDYIPITYMRGFIKSKEFKGHNTESSKKYIEKRIKKLEKRKLKTSVDFFRIGIMIHYIADSFTYPHNETFCGNVRTHIAYEYELHKTFNSILKRNCEKKKEIKITELLEYIKNQHVCYDQAEQSFINDCNFILNVCLNVLNTLMNSEEYQKLNNEKVINELITSN